MIRSDTRNNRQSGGVWPLICAATLLAGVMPGPAFPQQGQTREECNSCCERSGLDEYYTDQCKLKCFRNNDHCRGKAHEPTSQAVTPQAPSAPKLVAPAPRESSEPTPRPRPPRNTHAPNRPQHPPFAYPETLVLSPGNEWQAADQILERNGIPKQHPNYMKAMQNIQGLLIAFGRANPQGGDLPTDELERIVNQYR